MNPHPATRFAGLPPRIALLILGWTAAAIAACLYVSLATDRQVPAADRHWAFSGLWDWSFYDQVVHGVRDGTGYYRVLPPLFAKYDYVPFSVLNFRTPVYAYAAALPNPTVGVLHFNLLTALGAAGLVLGVDALRRDGGPFLAMCGALFLAGGLAWCVVGPGYLFSELWAGVLILLSLCAYRWDWWPLAVLAGLAALFFRELALPYCGIALVLAVQRRRWLETASWLVGLTLYALFMAWHIRQVRPLVVAPREGIDYWVGFNGLTFLLETCRANFFQGMYLPGWTAAVYLPLAVLGLLGWRGEMGTRACLTLAAYLAIFSVFGQWFNGYWGLLYAPLLALGAAWSPVALWDLARAWRSVPVAEVK